MLVSKEKMHNKKKPIITWSFFFGVLMIKVFLKNELINQEIKINKNIMSLNRIMTLPISKYSLKLIHIEL